MLSSRPPHYSVWDPLPRSCTKRSGEDSPHFGLSNQDNLPLVCQSPVPQATQWQLTIVAPLSVGSPRSPHLNNAWIQGRRLGAGGPRGRIFHEETVPGAEEGRWEVAQACGGSQGVRVIGEV